MEPLTTAQAAEQLQVSTRHVRRLIAKGELQARPHGRDNLIDPTSLEQCRRLRSA